MKTNTDAVSPVVGVMLMLVVTIIIAAVVSAFAGGMSEGTEVAPQASIDCRFMQDDGGMGPAYVEWKMVFEHLSGDPVPSRDLEIITYYTLSNGTVIKHQQTAAGEKTDLYGYGTLTRVPFINDMSLGYSGDNPLKDYGNFTWKAGDVLSTGSDAGTSTLLGFDITDPANEFGSGSVVEVRILHIPSSKFIYDKEVVVL
jgi:FlaG/FlaF family flagellin (archaellin)